jgi:hypothetical protein
MAFCANYRFQPLIALALLVTSACNSGPSSRQGREGGATASDPAGSHIDVMCIGDRINNPPGPFHYSYKYADASRSLDNEADITPDKMDITIQDKSGLHSYHGVHSDEASWNAAVLDLSNLSITEMSARLNSLNDSSAITNQGAEAVNGYNTAKYVIDTTSASPSDKQKFETLFGKRSFEKGTVWVPSDGCAVKLILEEEIFQMDGSVHKAHYEIAMIKK